MTREEIVAAFLKLIAEFPAVTTAGEAKKLLAAKAPALMNITLADLFSKLTVGDFLDISEAVKDQ